ncbi:DUF4148 domain-containing protein [Bacillus sp. NPDC060175]|uniref:DUF4148 domain-containing protein n=1 Tax=Bacillus sp. NPDC060175 TaxID=3347061 RepID=UPI003651C839
METTTYVRTTKCEAKQGKKSKTQLEADLSALIDTARSKYGNDYVIVNEGNEIAPNWKIVHQPKRGSGGINEADIFDRWR